MATKWNSWERGRDGAGTGWWWDSEGCRVQGAVSAPLELTSAVPLTSQPSQAWFVSSLQTTARHPCPPDFAQGLSPVRLSVIISDL